MALKTAILRNTAWMKKQHDMPCFICGSEGTTCGAHQRLNGGGGTGIKPPDSHCIPLCQAHHDAEHKGWNSFWKGVIEGYPHVLKNLLLARAREIYREYFADEGEAILLDALQHYQKIDSGSVGFMAHEALKRYRVLYPNKN